MIRIFNFFSVTLIICFFYIQNLNAQEFNKLTTENGLSTNTVDFITEDEDGFIYIGTPFGLNVFNGTSFKIYNATNTENFSNQIKCILPINNELILIGTLDIGLFIFNKRFGSIIPLKIEENNKGIQVQVYALHKDKNNTIWVGTKAYGLLKITSDQLNIIVSNPLFTIQIKNIKLKINKHINTISSTGDILYIGTLKNGLYTYDIQSINEDFTLVNTTYKEIWDIKRSKNKIYVAQDGGLEIINLKTQKHQLLLQQSILNKGSKNTITSISIDNYNHVWVSTLNDGLYSISAETNNILDHFTNNPTDSRTLNINKIITTFIDKQQNLWLGTWHGGLNFLSLKANAFLNYRYKDKSNDLSQNITWDITPFTKNMFLIGSNGNGICQLNLKNDYFEKSPILNHTKFVKSLLIDRSKKDLWVGTWESGLIKYNLNSKKSVNYLNEEEVPLRIQKMTLDKNKRLWIGTDLNGLYSLNTNDPTAKPQQHFVYPNYNVDINSGYIDVRSIVADEDNTLWVGSLDHGLLKIKTDLKGTVLNSSLIEVSENLKKSYKKIRSIYLDSNNNLWIGYENGVVKYNTISEKIISFPDFDDVLISGFLEDLNNNIWVISYDGLYRYNQTNQKISHYFSGTVFQSIAQNKFTSNKILLSSNHGIFVFDPEEFKFEKQIPKIMISSYIDDPNSELTPDSNELIRLNYKEQLIQKYQNNSLNVKASTLYFGESGDNEILYKLENYDSEWNKRSGSETIITYKNIPHGNYKLLIKASTQNDSENNPIKSLDLTILSPWWNTWYARTIYFLTILIILIYIKFTISERHRQKIMKIASEKDKELNDSKLAFFTNVSHDVRTPLTLILGPLESLLAKDIKDTWENKQHRIIHKNTDLLLKLTNQILDFRKLDSGKMKLKASKADINYLVKSCINQFESALFEKKIEIQLNNNSSQKELWIDSNKMEKVFINLFSNAIKFSDFKKDIIVKISSSEKYVTIKIINYGTGIPSKELPNIFERFYQSGYHKGGSGIGLSIVKSIVEIHYGKIKVNSKPNKETAFTIKLPLGKAHLKPEEIISEQLEYQPKKFQPIKLIPSNENKNDKKIKETLLIIEDNHEIRNYLKEILEDEFNIVDVNNGAWGIEKAEALIPSLVISDIMMDGIDGIEVCRTLKNNIDTSHIPIILLSAKNTDEDKIDGYNEGADDYITKPFNTELLKTRIRSLLEQRKRLKKKLKLPMIEPKAISPTSVDESFIERTMKILEENMSNNLLSIEDLSQKMDMSQNQFYRKIKNLTGYSASKFIQVVRLKRAAQLLSTGKFKISDVLYEVGYTSPSYFTKSFKKHFGKSPTEFLEKN